MWALTYFDLVVLAATLLSGAAVIYHHLIYPLVLKIISRRKVSVLPEIPLRGYCADPQDRALPAITIVMPAYNESTFIAEKIRNLAQLDYPASRLRIEIHCDGCTDATAKIARSVLLEPECRWLPAYLIEHRYNRGKLAVINDAIMKSSNSELVVLTDVSALIPMDALLASVAHLQDHEVGAVSGGYRLLNPGSSGEEAYWQYQTSIKMCESKLGSVMGSHGAFYVFRRALFTALEEGVINDDFVLPMRIAAQGKRIAYEPRIQSLELEQANDDIEFNRRRRIAAGNVQQVIKLWFLLNPLKGWLAFNFASGKALRAIMPFLLLSVLAGSIWLSSSSVIFFWFSVLQMSVYLIVALGRVFQISLNNRYIKTVDYLVNGHWAGLVGAVRYLLGLERKRWQRVGE